ncbi:MAG: ATP-binding protein [Candidatus Sumerlaeaceae bacterium]|nr:ATP-binding protein [Candidatus Sumerlaeaceae bacterium]
MVSVTEPPRNRLPFGIRTKLLVLLFAVGLFPCSVAIFVLYRGAVATTKNALALELLERVQGVMSALDDSLQVFNATALSLKEHLEQGAPPSAALANVPPTIEAAAIIERDGRIVYSHNVPIESGSVVGSLPPAVNETTASILADEETTGPLASNLRLFLAVDENRYLVLWAKLTRLVEPFVVSMPGDQTQLALVTNRGNVIASQPPPRPLVQAVLSEGHKSRAVLAQWLEIPSEHQPGYVVAFRASSFWRQRQKEAQTSLDWYAVAYTDTQFVLPALNTLLWRLVGVGILLAIGLAALSAAVSTKFLKPLHLLHQQVEAVRRGEWVDFEGIRTGDELEELERAFGAMLAEIRQSREALEHQIIRTQTRANQVQLVNEISRAILASFSLHRLLETSESQLANILPIRSVILWLFAEQGETILTSTPSADDANARVRIERVLKDHRDQLRSGKMLAHLRLPLEGAGESALAVRLAVPGGELGYIILHLVPGAKLTEEHEQFVEQLAPFFSLVIQHINLYEQVSKFAAELEKKVAERAAQLEQAHRQLLQTERLAVTGQLAAGVAHEINNPLGIIKNLLQVLRIAPTPSQETIGIIEEEIDRIARIVRSLLEFARPPAAIGPPADVKKDVFQVLQLLQPELRKRRVEVDIQISDNLPSVAMTSDHFKQVVLNLLRNAEQAVADGGHILINGWVETDKDNLQWVIIEVCDDGVGIPPDVLPRIFEPFFTTKRSRDGMGLGLSVTYGLVSAAGGKIDVNSREGEGTTFKLRIPAYRVPSTEQKDTH